MKINTLRAPAGRERTGGWRPAGPAPRLVTLAALGLLAAACGPNRAPVAGPATEMAVRTSYECSVEPAAQVVAGPAGFADVARLEASVRELLRAAGRERADLLLTLEFEADGLNTRRMIINHDVDPILSDSVQKLVFASLVRAPASATAWGTRLRIRAEPEVRLSLEPRQYCPPRPRNPLLEESMAQFMGSGVRYRNGERERIILLALQVHPAGYVQDVRVLRGAPTGGTVERELRDYARQFSFYPASLDGDPVPGEIAVPVRVRG
jgi:hypothetical protein